MLTDRGSRLAIDPRILTGSIRSLYDLALPNPQLEFDYWNAHDRLHFASAWSVDQEECRVPGKENGCHRCQGGQCHRRYVTHLQSLLIAAIGALRMIKMFGWEDRIKERIAVKREDELDLIWKRRLVNL
jgi:hypothetical protein